jgi:hypothetical protein
MILKGGKKMRISKLHSLTLKTMLYFFRNGKPKVTNIVLLKTVSDMRVYEVRKEVFSRSCFMLVDNGFLNCSRSRSGRIIWALTEKGYNLANEIEMKGK